MKVFSLTKLITTKNVSDKSLEVGTQRVQVDEEDDDHQTYKRNLVENYVLLIETNAPNQVHSQT